MTKHRTRFMKLCIFCKPICKQPNSFHAFKIWTKTNLSLLHKHSKHYVIMYTGPDFTPEAFTCFHTHHILSNNEKNTKQMAFYQRKIKCNCVLHLIHHLLNDLLWKKNNWNSYIGRERCKLQSHATMQEWLMVFPISKNGFKCAELTKK